MKYLSLVLVLALFLANCKQDQKSAVADSETTAAEVATDTTQMESSSRPEQGLQGEDYG